MATKSFNQQQLENVLKLYDQKRLEAGPNAWRYIPDILEQYRPHFMAAYEQSPNAQKKKNQGKQISAQNAWNNFKGHTFEELIMNIIQKEIQALGLECVFGKELLRPKLPKELDIVARLVEVRYGVYSVIPDTDLVIYQTAGPRVVGIISCKTSLRERVAQTAFWKIKLSNNPVTESIRVYFVTSDDDKNIVRGLDKYGLNVRNRMKNRILVEHELDGTYVLRDVEESQKVKTFDKFIEDLRMLLGKRR